ncbi:MAG: YdaU family protein [Methylophilaceae bacterium]
MHYYQFNVGDYRRTTAHLTPIEHYIYRSLMDWYYLDEKPIPNKTQLVLRWLSLGLDQETQLENVLNDFFILEDEVWKQRRIDNALNEYHAKAETNKINGKKGGRPKNPNKNSENKTQLKPSGLTNANPSESELNPNQEPRTKNQELNKESVVNNPPMLAGLICKKLHEIGFSGVNPSNPKFIRMLNAGATEREFIDKATTIIDSSKRTFAYLLGAVEGARRDAENSSVIKGDFGNKYPVWYVHASGIEAKAREIGLDMDLAFPYLKQKVYKHFKVTEAMVNKARADFDGKRA